MLVDFGARGPHTQRLMPSVIVFVWVVVMIPTAYFMLRNDAEKLFERVTETASVPISVRTR